MLKSIHDLESFLNEHRIFDRLSVSKLGIFGSFARGENANDIDILISENEPNKSNLELYKIAEELQHSSGIKFDLVRESQAEPIILYRAKKDIKYVQKY
jgi:predicted nucleotidyltransferase